MCRRRQAPYVALAMKQCVSDVAQPISFNERLVKIPWPLVQHFPSMLQPVQACEYFKIKPVVVQVRGFVKSGVGCRQGTGGPMHFEMEEGGQSGKNESEALVAVAMSRTATQRLIFGSNRQCQC